MTGKHRDRGQIPLERPHSSGEGKVVPKPKCPARKSPLASKGLKGSEELHLQQATVDGFSPAECTRSTGKGEKYFFQAYVGVNPETTVP